METVDPDKENVNFDENEYKYEEVRDKILNDDEASPEPNRVEQENGEDIVAEINVPVVEGDIEDGEVVAVQRGSTRVSKLMKRLNDEEMYVLKLRKAIEEYKTGKYSSIIQCAKDHDVNRITLLRMITDPEYVFRGKGKKSSVFTPQEETTHQFITKLKGVKMRVI